ncbi:acetate/propionate family kinase [Tabrizicola fusiformis]|uniref:acetate/propionate family kinase n=1 Tax=Tabrizicola sp. SY72 TaxID=2741673 RepID=UPI001571B195|nr:acetate kinase [Tabrizicola sp. SY72]NTT86521.1 acetate kinase [Tabrizicola sp. SY72]
MLLVVNAGSSSIKLAVFDAALVQVAWARVTEIGAAALLEGAGRREMLALPDHTTAMAAALATLGLPLSALRGAAHRVVHGGAALVAPCRITPAVEAAIADCIPLAPLHNPANLTGIRAVTALAPDLPQYASFDTAFHASNPELATAYALPAAERARGIRRYGFHGLSYAALVNHLGPLAKGRLLACHLGNGASLCAIRDGVSLATTMGYSPLDGLTMGTRTGSIDGNAVLRLAELHGIDGAARILNRESGLLALGGASDMRALRAAGADFALDHFAYWAVRHAGSMVAAMGGLDAIAFTGGIGEHDAAMRAAIVQGLGFLGAALDPDANAAHAKDLTAPGARVAIWTVPAEEERQIAREAMGLIARKESA